MAVHRAVRAIQSGECDVAIAGGVNVILSPTGFDAFTSSGMLAADGRCKTFDHRADGYARGEGVGPSCSSRWTVPGPTVTTSTG